MSPSRTTHLASVLEGQLRDAASTLRALRRADAPHGDIPHETLDAIERWISMAGTAAEGILEDGSGPASPLPRTLREPSNPPPPASEE